MRAVNVCTTRFDTTVQLALTFMSVYESVGTSVSLSDETRVCLNVCRASPPRLQLPVSYRNEPPRRAAGMNGRFDPPGP